MNKREMNIVRKKLLTKKKNITAVCGCYVSAGRQVISTFRHSLGSLPENEAAQYVFLFRKILTGEIGRSLLEAEFSPEQVQSGAQHGLLTEMNKSMLENADAVTMFYDNVIASLNQESNYLILLMHYQDMNYFAPDREKVRQKNDLDCILCCVCPVKLKPGELCFHDDDGEFHLGEGTWTALAPEVGFLFPAFENGGDNIYKVVYYTKDTASMRSDFTDAAFGLQLGMAAREQSEALSRILEETLGDECSLDAVQSVQEKVLQRVADCKEDKEAPSPVVSGQDVGDALLDAGISEEKVQAFSERYEETFGTYAQIPAVNAAPRTRMEVKLPDIVIRVSPEKSHLVTTRQEGDLTYIMIRADADVEVNGVRVKLAEIPEEE